MEEGWRAVCHEKTWNVSTHGENRMDKYKYIHENNMLQVAQYWRGVRGDQKGQV